MVLAMELGLAGKVAPVRGVSPATGKAIPARFAEAFPGESRP